MDADCDRAGNNERGSGQPVWKWCFRLSLRAPLRKRGCNDEGFLDWGVIRCEQASVRNATERSGHSEDAVGERTSGHRKSTG